MTRTRRPVRRNGNRRKRVAVVALIGLACAAIVTVALVVLLPNGVDLNEEARPHATTACDLIAKAGKAGSAHTPERYAAAALLLDKAMIESAQAAKADPKAADLDRATQAVHEAPHHADRTQWRNTLSTALSTCEEAIG
jgi:hypothetical protein